MSANVNGGIVPVWDGPGSPFTSVSSGRPPSALLEGSPGSSASFDSTSPKLLNASVVTSIPNDSQGSIEPTTSSIKGRGRKRKRKAVTMEDKLADVTSLLKGQFAKANELRTGIRRVPPPTPVNIVYEVRSPSSPDPGYPLSATLSPDDQLIKNDLVEKYLKSQSELKSQMERQYQDRLSRNEFQDSVDSASVTAEDAETTSSVNSVIAAPYSPSASEKNRPKVSKKGEKSSARKRKKELEASLRSEADSSAQNSFPFVTEDEILSKLPPIDPEILAEVENFVFDSYEQQPAETKNLTKIETDRLSDTPGTSGMANSQAASETKNKLFDFGDSDEEDDDDLVEVETPEESSSRLKEEHSFSSASTLDEEEEIPIREVDESEVTRLHEEQIENLNGNFEESGTFREWHETLLVPTYGDPVWISTLKIKEPPRGTRKYDFVVKPGGLLFGMEQSINFVLDRLCRLTCGEILELERLTLSVPGIRIGSTSQAK